MLLAFGLVFIWFFLGFVGMLIFDFLDNGLDGNYNPDLFEDWILIIPGPLVFMASIACTIYCLWPEINFKKFTPWYFTGKIREWTRFILWFFNVGDR